MASGTSSLGDALRAAETVSQLLAAPEAPCSRTCTAPGKIHWWGAGLGDAGCEVFARTIEGPKYTRSHEALKNVLLGGNFLGPACMQHLSSAAKKGTFKEVSSLGLSRNRLGDEGTCLLMRMISSGALQPGELYLSSNGISSRGAAALASAIASTPTWHLVKLSIGNNLISGAGALELARALCAPRVSGGVRLLNLERNALGDESVAEFARCLRTDSSLGASLQELRLDDNLLSNASLAPLAAALSSATRLRVLSLGGNRFSASEPSAQALKRECAARRIRCRM